VRAGVATAPARRAPSAAAEEAALVERPTEQAHLIVGVPAPPRDHPDRHALMAIDHVLGGGMSSRLFQTIREERGLAYSVFSYRTLFETVGSLAVYAGTSPGQARMVLELVHEALDDMATRGITAEELDGARSHLRGSLTLGLEDSGARMSRIGHAQLVHGRVPDLDEVEARLDALTVDSVAEAAARWLSGPRTVAAVGPFDDASLLVRA
jgi:predicted Zn-dependent peptidase